MKRRTFLGTVAASSAAAVLPDQTIGPGEPAAAKPTKITLLGTGTPAPSLERQAQWDQGADRIPDLDVYGPPPIKRMTDLLFAPDGVYGPDTRARIEHQSSIDQFTARGGTPPRKRLTAARPTRSSSWPEDATCSFT
jgi:hypothetical protein